MEERTPAGSPLITTKAVPEKPFWGVKEIVTGVEVVPSATERVEGETVRVKSGERDDEEAPPQPAKKIKQAASRASIVKERQDDIAALP